eukprot:CAMPEP_0176048844 /NCGR_PEP_ID=MMETSP0120_2-20121206/24266_1 /TAXON_ID=160619 /ORGANISM="Kryptoperidinium foliaceum, Strain CCMP 1326" /LENGTH=187 /DNA_ID=CAMNT_0017382265 /DNA_START=190 /DNA_END=750 /DNA_ORIENTATION=-
MTRVQRSKPACERARLIWALTSGELSEEDALPMMMANLDARPWWPTELPDPAVSAALLRSSAATRAWTSKPRTSIPLWRLSGRKPAMANLVACPPRRSSAHSNKYVKESATSDHASRAATCALGAGTLATSLSNPRSSSHERAEDAEVDAGDGLAVRASLKIQCAGAGRDSTQSLTAIASRRCRTWP